MKKVDDIIDIAITCLAIICLILMCVCYSLYIYAHFCSTKQQQYSQISLDTTLYKLPSAGENGVMIESKICMGKWCKTGLNIVSLHGLNPYSLSSVYCVDDTSFVSHEKCRKKESKND